MPPDDATRLADFTATAIDGAPWPLERLAGRVALVVNTASACGFTPQLAGLQALHARHAAEGLAVLGFPCNQFGRQDPSADAEIAAFCARDYGVGFPMMAKVEVNGPGAHPLFRWLQRRAPGVLGSRPVKWNFTKFLVERDGRTVRRFAPWRPPASLETAIARALTRPAPR
ncbi:MAG: glutathione peroxidase [Xylophilus ampelinus]